MKKIILTGGGTAGHVIPNLSLVPALKKAGFEISYIGSHKGIERGIVEAAGIPYYGIASGKLRRYFDVKNFTDLFRISKGVIDSLKIIRKIKPDIIFSKGGFVVVPVITAARLCKVKTIIHESDITPGLANKLVLPFSSKICVSFPETLKHVPASKSILTGTPIRESLQKGSRLNGFKFVSFEPNGKPIVLITGGSQGALSINECVREALPEILKNFRVVHLCGKGHLANLNLPGYAEFEYVSDDMPDIFQIADIVVSRAGANTIFELLALKKPHILIPLPKEKSRGDQILNANSFSKQGFSKILPENEMTKEYLVENINDLYKNRNKYMEIMLKHESSDSIGSIINAINDVLKM